MKESAQKMMSTFLKICHAGKRICQSMRDFFTARKDTERTHLERILNHYKITAWGYPFKQYLALLKQKFS